MSLSYIDVATSLQAKTEQ